MFVFAKVFRNSFLDKIEILFRLLRRYVQLHIFRNQSYDVFSEHTRAVMDYGISTHKYIS